MVYQGSKDKLAKYIVPIIHKYISDYNIKNYYELFVGGANLIDKIECDNKYGYDYNEFVITLLQYAQKDNSLSIAPNECSFEHYKEVREYYNKRDYSAYSKEYISLIGYMASYGGRFYDGGYARGKRGDDSSNNTKYMNNLNNLRKQAPKLKDIIFKCQTYNSINPDGYENCLFYLDPPYKNTKNMLNRVLIMMNFIHFVAD